MTGHGRATADCEQISADAEVRSVNSRYLKLSVNCGERFVALQPKIESLVRKFIQRGTVYVTLRIQQHNQQDQYLLNADVIRNYQRQLGNLVGNGTVKVESLLSLPGVVQESSDSPVDVEQDWDFIQQAVEQSLKNHWEMRAKEGAAMAADLSANVNQIHQHVEKISQLAPNVVQRYSDRLTTRINQILEKYDVTVEASDVVREIGVFAERTDISEELVRLQSHLGQFDAVIDGDQSNGRKLDFLTQELLRETNTIGSKANDSGIAIEVVEIKSAIERIREMVQNIE